MQQQHRSNSPIEQNSWDSLLASISDADLDLLIAAGEKMRQGEAVLTRRELEACLRWHPKLDVLPFSKQ